MTDFFSIVAVILAFGAGLLGVHALNEKTTGTIWQDPKQLGEIVVQTMRQRAALVICAGAVLCLVDYLIFPDAYSGTYQASLHQSHYAFLLGSLTILVGVYHWIAGPPQDKI